MENIIESIELGLNRGENRKIGQYHLNRRVKKFWIVLVLGLLFFKIP